MSDDIKELKVGDFVACKFDHTSHKKRPLAFYSKAVDEDVYKSSEADALFDAKDARIAELEGELSLSETIITSLTAERDAIKTDACQGKKGNK